MKHLNFSMREIEDIVILDLSGHIGLGRNSEELRLNLRALASQGKRQAIINMAGVNGIDSIGLGTLVAGFATLRKNGGHLKLANVTPKVAKLMTVAKLNTVFEIFEDELKAIDSFNVGQKHEVGVDSWPAKVRHGSSIY